MQNCEITRIDKIFQIVKICEIAKDIWNSHYVAILGQEQVDYMLNKLQSPKAIGQQIEKGFDYYILSTDGQDFGYMAVLKEQESLFLSKFYFLEEFRGNGYAKTAMNFLKDLCVRNNLKNIHLYVNKKNFSSIEVYKKLGFQIVDEEVIDIDGGYYMDDYVMLLNI